MKKRSPKKITYEILEKYTFKYLEKYAATEFQLRNILKRKRKYGVKMQWDLNINLLFILFKIENC